ncbi:hypothetical protein [Paenibacillus sp. KN14-4R]|uniref:hypothetical protein n=1 Tax=Paenibacillus sp. KN14-4R TaxID=3445773 RepID=UPI003F9FD05A
MINKLFKLLILISLIILSVSCSKDKESDPIQTSIQMKQAIFFNDFEDFQSLFSSQRKSAATKEMFRALKEIEDPSADYKSYTLITLGNGRMLLVNHTPGKDYKIQDIVIVPEDLKILFEDEIKSP